MAAEPCSAAIFLGAISEGLCREATEGISELPAGTWNLYQIGSSVFSIILPCLQIVHSRRPILAQKPRCPTENARIREHLRVVRMRNLGFLAGERLSTCNNLPSRGSIRGIPRFSCQNLVFAVYFLREEARYLSNIRRIPKNPGLPDCEPAHLPVYSTARTPQSSKENEAQILN